jgi:hypothetical protein
MRNAVRCEDLLGERFPSTHCLPRRRGARRDARGAWLHAPAAVDAKRRTPRG